MVGDSLGRSEEPGYRPLSGLDFLLWRWDSIEEPKSVRNIPLVWKGCRDQLEGCCSYCLGTGPERAVGCRQGLFLQNREGLVTSEIPWNKRGQTDN